jgi:hypothetical protein
MQMAGLKLTDLAWTNKKTLRTSTIKNTDQKHISKIDDRPLHSADGGLDSIGREDSIGGE